MSDKFYKSETVFRRHKGGDKTCGGLIDISIKIPFKQGSLKDIEITTREILKQEMGSQSDLYETIKLEYIE
jgi:hypothetical protein